MHARLLDRGLLAGLVLSRWYPDDPVSSPNALLLCATELTTDEDIARLVDGLREALA